MHALSKAVLLAILAVQASAATLSHGVRSPHHHAAIAHHAARAPESADGVSPVSNSLRRRQKVCRKRTSSLVPASTSSSSSSTKEPEPTTTKQPEPTTTKKPDPTTTKAPTTTQQPTTTKEATTTKASGGGGYYGGTNTGQGTFYNTGLVACGQTYTDDSYTAAVSIPLFDNFPGATGNPNNNPLCGKWLYAWRKGDPSRNVKVQVVDRCAGCAPKNVDFTPTAFNHLGDPSEGRIDIEWTWA